MSNIHDYLLWRGDLSLTERPFNDVDNLVLCTLSYLDFTGIVPDDQTHAGISLSSACHRLIDICHGDISSRVNAFLKIETRFVALMANSARFGAATLRAYVDEVDEARSLQFSAMQIDLPNGETYVVFRGTDCTIVGWREDFMLGFEVTEAQREAARYLDGALKRAEEQGLSVRVGGHSKGGNLAEFAAASCTSEQLKRIVRVYSNDGPCMAPEVMKRDTQVVLGDRLRRIVPSYSVIGMIFANPDDPRIIVESTGVAIGQHDLTTWQVLSTGVLEALELQPECVVANDAFARWTEGISLEERERVTNEIFDALQAGGATRFEEIASSAAGLQQVLLALSKTDERTQELALALVDGTVGTSMSAMRKATQDAFDQWRQNAQTVADDAARLFQAGSRDIRVPLSSLRANRRRHR